MPHALGQNKQVYYLQNMKYQGNDLLLATDWFESTGVKEGFERKKEIQIAVFRR